MISLPGHKNVAGAVVWDRRSYTLHAFRHSHQQITLALVEPFAQKSAACSRPDKHDRTVQITPQKFRDPIVEPRSRDTGERKIVGIGTYSKRDLRKRRHA